MSSRESSDDRRTRAQLELIATLTGDLDRASVRHWLIGGWAVDFHLGRISRLHSDVDLVLWNDDRDRLAPILHGRGFQLDPARSSEGVELFTGPDGDVEVTYLAVGDGGTVVTAGYEPWPYEARSFGDLRRTLEGVEAPVTSASALLDAKQEWQRVLGEPPRPHDLADIGALQSLAAHGHPT